LTVAEDFSRGISGFTTPKAGSGVGLVNSVEAKIARVQINKLRIENGWL